MIVIGRCSRTQGLAGNGCAGRFPPNMLNYLDNNNAGGQERPHGTLRSSAGGGRGPTEVHTSREQSPRHAHPPSGTVLCWVIPCSAVAKCYRTQYVRDALWRSVPMDSMRHGGLLHYGGVGTLTFVARTLLVLLIKKPPYLNKNTSP